MEDRKIYEDIALRTEGDIYIGVVGPVRTGKSTFIKRFMESLVLPNIKSDLQRERATDELPQSVLAAAIFWVAGYLAYGVLCFFSAPTAAKSAATVTLSTMPVQPPAISARPDMPAAKSSVRLEHAISVTDKLLLKNLGKGDRQELEKLKGTLSVLQTKGTLSPLESDILNDNFNALLKLMAKYNI